MNYRILYIPAGVNAPRPREIRARIFHAINPHHAAVRADTFEQRTGARVLTLRKVVQ